mmetsp:Transcript_11218/g.25582  ORF Transcript_11218/g.25582 Transcript_11218/m.25582 type:complete len:218 (-) Transcript_11218:15-668(-)
MQRVEAHEHRLLPDDILVILPIHRVIQRTHLAQESNRQLGQLPNIPSWSLWSLWAFGSSMAKWPLHAFWTHAPLFANCVAAIQAWRTCITTFSLWPYGSSRTWHTISTHGRSRRSRRAWGTLGSNDVFRSLHCSLSFSPHLRGGVACERGYTCLVDNSLHGPCSGAQKAQPQCDLYIPPSDVVERPVDGTGNHGWVSQSMPHSKAIDFRMACRFLVE